MGSKVICNNCTKEGEPGDEAKDVRPRDQKIEQSKHAMQRQLITLMKPQLKAQGMDLDKMLELMEEQ